jgi:hypothetical protein
MHVDSMLYWSSQAGWSPGGGMSRYGGMSDTLSLERATNEASNRRQVKKHAQN